MFCPYTNLECRSDCVMYDEAEPDEDGNPVGAEQNCLQRIKVATEIDYYVAATEALENIPQTTEPAPAPQ